MSRYKRYEKYKDSGVEWIGEIPEHWGIIKLKFLSTIFKGKNPKELTDEWREEILPYLSMEYLRNSGDTLTLYAYPEKNLVTVNNGDILILWDGSNAGEILEGKNGILSSTMAKIVPNNIVTRYLYWFLKGIEKFFKGNTVGMGIPHVNGEILKNHLVLLPNLEEQNSIANFLDQKTAEIDDLIADKEKLIELLQEKRQAIITEVITKGLNPNVSMKDSGVEWIGEIPEHWKVTKLKYVAKQIIDGTHSTPQYTDDGIPFLRVTDITNARKGPINLDEVKYISEEEHRELIKRCNPKKGDLLVSKNGTIGIPKVVDWDYEFSIFVSLCLIKVNRKVDVYYCSYYFESNFINTQIAFGGKTNTITNLHLDKIREFILPLPPIEEQKTIVNYLNKRTDEIDSLINDIQLQIQKLKEYRQSLIFEAITGKIDVRDYVVD